jgi:hypothetical protein
MSVVSVVFCQVEVSATGLVTRPEESYRLWCVVVCDVESSTKSRPWFSRCCCAMVKRNNNQKTKYEVLDFV